MNEFEAKAIKYVVFGFITLITLMVGSCQTTKYQIRKMVESGKATAFEAECSLSDSCNSNAMLMRQMIEKTKSE